MDTGPIIPRKWVNELAVLEYRGLRGFIAGGAVRDLILRRPHKDVDVWLTADKADAAARAASEACWKVVVEGGYVSSDLIAVYEYEHDGETYNVIVTRFDDQDTIVRRFDFGISRAVIKRLPCPIGSGTFPIECELQLYPEFLEDLNRKVFKVRHDNGAKRTAKRWARFSERYPDWSFEDLEDPFANL